MVQKARSAGFWIRAVADVMDSLLLDIAACLIGLMVLGGIFWARILFSHLDLGGASFFGAFDPFVLQIAWVAIRGVLSFGYFSWATYQYGTTVGKRAFGIYVVTAEGHSTVTLKQSMIRCLSYIASYFPFGAGFLMVAFQPEKRALHDLIAGTVSIVRRKK